MLPFFFLEVNYALKSYICHTNADTHETGKVTKLLVLYIHFFGLCNMRNVACVRKIGSLLLGYVYWYLHVKLYLV